MARTPLAKILQKSFAVANAEMEKRKIPSLIDRTIDPLIQNAEKNQHSTFHENEKMIVIVGAGLAGLTAAYRLKQNGIKATIYEASDRVGGRCWTRRGYFNENQIVERGGELIDTGHKEIQLLAQELGLELDHLVMAEPSGTLPFYYFDNEPYSFQDVTNNFLEIYPKLQADLIDVGEITLYNQFTKRGFELDHMSIVDYINEIVPGGIHSKFGKLLSVAYTIENGADAHEQSALSLLYLLGYAEKGQFQIFGDSDECYHIKGGNDQVPTLLAQNLDGQIQYNSQLIRIEQNELEKLRLVFSNGDKEFEVLADKVILTIPFKILKMLDYQNARFRPLKNIAIEELGMGVSTKLHVQFVQRFWNEHGNNGETFADTGYQNTFESSRAQQGESGILINLTGGETARDQVAFSKTEIETVTKSFLDKIESVLPGSERNWNGLATVDHWLSNEWTKGSYSYWKVGQYTKFAGIIGEREGNIFFAGEHTSNKYPGYLNGAVESGERVAQEIMEDLLNSEE